METTLMTYHVLIPDNVDAVALDILRECDVLQLTAPGNMSRTETLATVPTAHALIIRSATTVDAELLAVAPNLKVVARAGVGVDNVDLDAATAQGVVVMNTPGGNTISTAEHAFGLMLALARHIPQGDAALRDGLWERKAFTGVELRNKTLGVVGLGRIGYEVAKRALAFEMRVVAFDPTPTRIPEDVEMVNLETLYARSDFITLHAPAMDATRGMINATTLAQMKPGVRIVNAARGALINDYDLAQAVKSGHVAGVALDVYEFEPPPPDHPLVGLRNVISTPHLAASTSDAQVNVAIEAAQLVRDALTTGTYQNVVNPSVL
jgi:D-3-phosphoglycerate dehydrogenase / 2-oxoglutarate reductase